MNIQKAYNAWAANYDADKNLTRDLDAEVVRKEFAYYKFDSILEIGCGTGKNTGFLSKISKKVIALDFSENMISKAREKVNSENVSFIVSDITKEWEIGNDKFDLITFNLILEHIENLETIFLQTKKHLKPNGVVFLCELHPFRQYDGKKAVYVDNGMNKEIDAYIHNISDFIDSAKLNGLKLSELKEYWHEQDQNKLPRILSLKFISS